MEMTKLLKRDDAGVDEFIARMMKLMDIFTQFNEYIQRQDGDVRQSIINLGFCK